MNLVKFQNTKLTPRNLLHPYTLTTKYQKEKARNSGHGTWGRTECSSIKELHGDHWGWVLGREREERPEGAVDGKTLKGYETRESCTKFMFLKDHTGCLGFPSGSDVKNLPAKQKMQVWSLSQEDLLEREWLPTQVFLPGTSHGQRSLMGYSPRGHKESDITYQLNNNNWLLVTSALVSGSE